MARKLLILVAILALPGCGTLTSSVSVEQELHGQSYQATNAKVKASIEYKVKF